MRSSLKEHLFLGFLMSIPILIILYVWKVVMGFLDIYNSFFRWAELPRELYTPVAIILTFLGMYGLGLFMKSRKVNSFMIHIRPIRNWWLFVKNIADRLSFISQGGYKKVFYEAFGPGTRRWRPAIVVGRTIFPDGNKKKRMLVVSQTPPNIFDPLIIPYEDTRIFTGTNKEFALYLGSAGTINPPEHFLEKWSPEEYEEIPDSSPLSNGNGKEDKEEKKR